MQFDDCILGMFYEYKVGLTPELLVFSNRISRHIIHTTVDV